MRRLRERVELGETFEQPLIVDLLGTQLLFERIERRRVDGGRKVVLPADFVVRESCGAKTRVL